MSTFDTIKIKTRTQTLQKNVACIFYIFFHFEELSSCPREGERETNMRERKRKDQPSEELMKIGYKLHNFSAHFHNNLKQPTTTTTKPNRQCVLCSSSSSINTANHPKRKVRERNKLCELKDRTEEKEKRNERTKQSGHKIKKKKTRKVFAKKGKNTLNANLKEITFTLGDNNLRFIFKTHNKF